MCAASGFDVRAARRHVRHSILERLPDIPRWVEGRSLLLAGDGEIFGLDEGHDLSVTVRDPSTGSVVVVGRPAPESVEAAVRDMMHDGTLIAAPENADWLAMLLPAWHRTRAILHTLRDPTCLPPESTDVGFLDPDAIDRLSISDQLRRELRIGAEDSPIAATFVDERPVSFCYAGSVTESWWDVAIDTLPEYRRRGYAASSAAHMIRYMNAQRKQPVWGAVEENDASWRLAEKLGFTSIDELALFEPPWARDE